MYVEESHIDQETQDFNLPPTSQPLSSQQEPQSPNFSFDDQFSPVHHEQQQMYHQENASPSQPQKYNAPQTHASSVKNTFVVPAT